MKAVIYCRVSQDRAHGRSVEEQEAEAREHCATQGWTVADVVTDSVGASRHSKGTRSGWARTHKLLDAGEVDVLVTWEASRASRDLTAYAELRDLCVRTGTLWSYSGRTHDLSKSDDRFRTGIDALFAEREADDTAERIQRAMRSNAAKGMPHGRRLFGYQRIYDPTTGALTGQVPDPDEAPVVRRIFAAYLAGAGLKLVADQLNADGITTGTGAAWEGTQVHRVLTNPAYVAKRVHRGEVVGDAVWPPLVDQDDFDNTQGLLAHRRTNPGQTSWKARLLSGVARCGLCGGRMWSGHDRNKRKVYMCRTFFHVSRDEAKLDDYVSRVIVAVLERGDVGDLLSDQPTPEVSEARRQVAELRDRLDDATAQFTAGKLTGGTLARIEAQLLAQISDAESRLRRNVIPLSFEVPATDVGEWWDKLEREQRRELVGVLLDAVVIHPTQRGTRVLDTSPDVIELHWRLR